MANLTPFSSRGSLWNLMRDFDDMFARLQNNWGVPSEITTAPMDLEETENAYLFSIDLPGIRKEDVKVDITQNTLSVTAERKQSENGPKFSERRYGKIQQTVTLPGDVDPDKIEAHHDNGVLEIVIPKSEQRQTRAIEIKSKHQIESSSTESAEASPGDLSKQAPIQDSPSATHH